MHSTLGGTGSLKSISLWNAGISVRLFSIVYPLLTLMSAFSKRLQSIFMDAVFNDPTKGEEQRTLEHRMWKSAFYQPVEALRSALQANAQTPDAYCHKVLLRFIDEVNPTFRRFPCLINLFPIVFYCRVFNSTRTCWRSTNGISDSKWTNTSMQPMTS